MLHNRNKEILLIIFAIKLNFVSSVSFPWLNKTTNIHIHHPVPPNLQPTRRFVALRVMTLNTFHAGSQVENGVDKMADHIKLVNADIVALQEINQTETDRIVQRLGQPWTHCSMPQTYWLDTAVITKRTVAEKYLSAEGFSNIGCKITILDYPRVDVNIWNIHLNYRNYGPYAACITPVASTLRELDDNEYRAPTFDTLSRVDSIVRLLNHQPVVINRFNAATEPLLLTGDFNAPSTLDWTYDARSRHCNWVNNWPVSRILMDAGFIDSYRQVYPNPMIEAGITWSPINFYNDQNNAFVEPQDRIDYIYYKSTKMNAVSSRTYIGTLPLFYVPNNYHNDWPSDHAAVVTDFDISLS